jgi:thioredoxin 1
MNFFSAIWDAVKPKRRILPVELNVDNCQASIQNSPVPVLIDFYSLTCVPCRQMAKTVIKFATDHQGRLRVGAFNTEQDTQGKILAPLKIRSVPTLVFFNKGKPVEAFVGITGYLKLAESFEKIEKSNA